MTKKLLAVPFAMAVVLGTFGGALERSAAGLTGSAEGGIALAQEAAPKPKESPYLKPDTRASTPLSLREAIEAAIANNLDVAISRKDPESASYGLSQARAAFDPLLESSASYGKSKSEPLSDFASQGDKFWSGDVAFSQVLQEGFRYRATWTTTKAETIYPPGAFTLPFFNPITPTYNSSLALSFAQPLLRGFGFGVNRTDIEIAQLSVSISEESFRGTVIDTLRQVENGYWDLYAAISNLQVARESLKLAQDLLDLNRKKVEVGTLAPIQITEAEASVATREESVILAEAGIRNAEDNLRRIMNVPPDSPDWDTAIEQTDKAPFEPAPVDLEEMIRKALEQRPEVIQARKSVRTGELRYRFAENGRLPGLDFVGAYTPRGNNYEFLGTALVDTDGDGTPDSSVNVIETGGLSDSASEVFDNDVYDWSVGLNLSIPIRNRNAKAAAARSKIAFEQAQMSLESLERGVRVEVRNAARAVDTGIKRVQAARSSVTLQEKKLEAEQKRYDNGMSTSFQVLTFQNDLTAARSGEIDAITAYNKALVELGRVTGTLPERRGISIASK